jgi:rhodanese-related sulfurtransferase
MKAERRNGTDYMRIGVVQARQLLTRPELLVLDVRDPNSYAQARIDTAVHIGRTNLDATLLGTPRNQPVLIYCYHGVSSQTYAQMFVDFGFNEVYSLDGGFERWHFAQAELAAVRPPLSAWLQQQGFIPARHDAVTANHNTPLMQASRLGDIQMVAALLDDGANVQARNADGNNALWHACFKNSLEVIDLLIMAGIDIDNQNDHGLSCLMCAAMNGKTPIVRRLLAAGANPSLRTRDCRSALDMNINVECGGLLREAVGVNPDFPLALVF